MAKKVIIDVDVNSGKAVDNVDKLTDALKEVNNEAKDVKDNTDDLGSNLKKAGTDGKDGLDSIKTGFKGVGTAIKAAGIGLVVAAFAALKEILEQQQPVLDAVDTTFTAVGLAITKIKESLSQSNVEFSALGTILGDMLTLSLIPIKTTFYAIKGAIVGAQLVWEKSFFGGKDKDKIAELEASLSDVGDSFVEIKDGAVNAATSIVDNIGEAVDEVTTAGNAIIQAGKDVADSSILEDARRTTELVKNAKIREALNKKLFEQYDREAELLRQQRDDTTLTAEERIAANDKLAEVLDEQERLMLANAAAITAAAQAELNANDTTENRVALINAEAEAEAIKADIVGKRSEQLINEIALEQLVQDAKDASAEREKERAENALALEMELKEARLEAGLEDPNATIDEILAKYEEKAALEDELYENEQVKIIDRFEQGLITEQEQNARLELLKLDHEKEKIKIASDGQKAEEAINNVRLSKQLEFANAVGNAIGAMGQLAEEGTAQQKVLALSEIAIGTGVGFINALTIAQKSAAGTGPGATFAFPIFFATQVAAVLGAASRAKSVLDKTPGGGTLTLPSPPSIGGGGGGGGGFPRGGNDPVDSPEFNPESLFSTESQEGALPETFGGGAGTNQQVIKAIVVESDITNTQNELSSFEQRSEIG